jgi:hypothetical protein
VAFPFALHPTTLHLGMDSDLARLREIPRRWRVFFGGACSEASYDTHWIRREFRMVPRSRVLEIISEELPTLTPVSADEVEELLAREFPGFVWPPESAAIPPERWLEVVAHAAVFAAAPGVSYPMCHNIIEAMAVGTVPLTEYPEQFDPPLRHGENCLAYSGESELRSRIREIEQMTPTGLTSLGRAAAEYYDAHIAPEAFVRSLEADPRPTFVLHLKGYERPPV